MVNVLLMFKVYLKRSPVWILASALGAFVLVLGLWFRIVERKISELYERPDTCFWQNWNSISSLGYGDMVPYSDPGRFLSLI
jgi:hypothetical protein